MREEQIGITRTTRYLTQNESFLFADGTVKKAYQIGQGCLLMHRSVVEKIPYRVEAGEDSHADTYLHIDLKKNNIPCYVDTRFMCQHENGNWNKIYKEYNV